MKAYVVIVALMLALVACGTDPCVEQGDSCRMSAALANLDARECTRIDSETIQSQCFSQVALAKNESTVCGNIKDSRIAAFCIAGVATARHDVATCRAIGIASARDACLYDLAPLLNVSLCGDIAQSAYGDDCAYDLALVRNDATSCLNIDERGRQYKCILIVAADTNSTQTCSLITDAEWGAWCKINLAVKNKDRTICEEVRDVKRYSECLAAVLTSIQNVQK